MQDIILKCLIVDDEAMAVEGIASNIAKVDFLKLTHTCSSALEASEVLRNNDIDLMFLDINMPTLTGLDFLESLKNPPLTIISTAYSEYAVDGFRLNAVDYILKPFTFKRFFQAVEKALEIHKKTLPTQAPQVPIKEDIAESVYIRVEDSYKKIFWRDIVYVEAMQNYLKLHFVDSMYIIHQTMSFIEEILPAKNFFRIHKSYLINTAYIDSIYGDKILVGSKSLPLSKYRKKELLDQIVLHSLISK